MIKEPTTMVMPHNAQIVYTVIWAAVVVAFAIYGAVLVARRRDPLLFVMLAGGAIAYFNEPIDDVLGLCWHPRPGQWVAVNTFGPAPLWGVFVYAALFGGIAFLMSEAFQRGVSRRMLWTWIGLFWLADLAVEIPAINSGMYRYYGDPPMKIAGLPMYWFAINIGAPVLTALVVWLVRGHVRGWRMLLLLPVPMVLDAACSVGMGWPIFSALHGQASTPVKYLAACASLAMGFAMLGVVIQFIARRSRADEPARTARPAVNPPPARDAARGVLATP